MRKYTHYFAEKSIQDLPEFETVTRRYPQIGWIEDYQEFRRENIVQHKACVVFARERAVWMKPFHCYENSAYRFLSLDLAEGCLFDCVYCYLQTYLNHGALVIFVNVDSLAAEFNELPDGNNWVSTGLLSDSL